jgi:hypothetical protein
MTESKVKHISATEAYDLIQKEPSTAFIDVRSDMEYLFIGHPAGAVNIPWIDEPDFVINPDFEREVRKLILGGVIASSAHDSTALKVNSMTIITAAPSVAGASTVYPGNNANAGCRGRIAAPNRV